MTADRVQPDYEAEFKETFIALIYVMTVLLEGVNHER